MMIETFSILSLMMAPVSDATTRFGDAGDLGRDLRWALREQLIELFDRDARSLAEDPDGRSGPLGEVLGPHETDDLPMCLRHRVDALPTSELGNHLFGPLLRVHEEALIVELDVGIGNRRGGHRSILSLTRGSGYLAGAGHGRAVPRDISSGQQAMPVEPLEHQLAEVVEPGLRQQRQASSV